MIMPEQLEIFSDDSRQADVAEFLSMLDDGAWHTRRQLQAATGWPERRIRDLAEHAGALVVRGQNGFKLVSRLTSDDIPRALEAAAIFEAQARRMLSYAAALRSVIHSKIG